MLSAPVPVKLGIIEGKINEKSCQFHKLAERFFLKYICKFGLMEKLTKTIKLSY